jgi:hypothetical protein
MCHQNPTIVTAARTTLSSANTHNGKIKPISLRSFMMGCSPVAPVAVGVLGEETDLLEDAGQALLVGLDHANLVTASVRHQSVFRA